MATISNTPRPGYAWDATDNVWYPIGTGTHGHSDYITAASAISPTLVDAKGDIIAASAADTVARLAVGTNEHRIVAASGETTGLKYVADTTNYAVAAKGDLLVGTAADTLAPLTVGANGTTLVADSAEATGLKWATPSTGGMTLLSTTTLSGASTTISSISGSYTNLQIFIYGMTNNTGQGQFKLTFNALGNNNNYTIVQFTNNATLATQINQNDAIYFTYASDNISRNLSQNFFSLTLNNYASATAYKSYSINGYYVGNNWNQGVNGGGGLNTTSAVNQIVLSNSGGTFSAGTCLIYGVK